MPAQEALEDTLVGFRRVLGSLSATVELLSELVKDEQMRNAGRLRFQAPAQILSAASINAKFIAVASITYLVEAQGIILPGLVSWMEILQEQLNEAISNRKAIVHARAVGSDLPSFTLFITEITEKNTKLAEQPIELISEVVPSYRSAPREVLQILLYSFRNPLISLDVQTELLNRVMVDTSLSEEGLLALTERCANEVDKINRAVNSGHIYLIETSGDIPPDFNPERATELWYKRREEAYRRRTPKA